MTACNIKKVKVTRSEDISRRITMTEGNSSASEQYENSKIMRTGKMK
jgi:hypothetical protein